MTTTDASPAAPRSTWQVWFATGGGLGYLPVGPGTWGSLPGLPLVWLLQQCPQPIWSCGLGGVVLFLVGIPLCNAGARHFQKKDPRQVVIDEIAAFPFVFLLVPLNWWTAIAGFLLFRLFDIAKPGPIRWLDRWEGGLGIMADDTLAGLFAGALLTAIYFAVH